MFVYSVFVLPPVGKIYGASSVRAWFYKICCSRDDALSRLSVVQFSEDYLEEVEEAIQ